MLSRSMIVSLLTIFISMILTMKATPFIETDDGRNIFVTPAADVIEVNTDVAATEFGKVLLGRIHDSDDSQIRLFKFKGPTRLPRSLRNLGNALECARPSCSPTKFYSYGCYCGPGGSGEPVDEIDRCCQAHDQCYINSGCNIYILEDYFTTYNYSCINNGIKCHGEHGTCDGNLCVCDIEFAHCLEKTSCPSSRAVCPSSKLRKYKSELINSWKIQEQLEKLWKLG